MERIRIWHALAGSFAWLLACGQAGPQGGNEQTSNEALTTSTLTCQTLSVKAGKIGASQTASALAVQDQTGSDDSWSKYVEFAPGTSVTCKYSLTAGMTAAQISALSLQVSYRGPSKSEMPWSFAVQDTVNGGYVKLGDNGFAPSWAWSVHGFDVPQTAHPISSAGVITIRYSTASTADFSDLDQLVVVVTTGATTTDSGTTATDSGTTAADSGTTATDSGTTATDSGTTATDSGATCAPSCSGKTCGSGDGCGGTCLAGSGCTASAGWWKPTNDKPLHFHWQLSDTFSYPNDMVAGQTVYDIDGDLNSAATVSKLHAAGAKAICYMEVGSVEKFRADYQAFVDAGVVGKSMAGWPGEFWLDISTQAKIDKILPLIKRRMVDWCVNKGFDAIEPDTSDVAGATPTQVVSYGIQVANLAHSLGIGIGLKNNAGSNATQLEPYYDWSLVEECWQYSECGSFQKSFLAKNKPVWNVEYSSSPNCTQANSMHMISMKRDLDLVGPHSSGYLYQPCMPDSQSTW